WCMFLHYLARLDLRWGREQLALQLLDGLAHTRNQALERVLAVCVGESHVGDVVVVLAHPPQHTQLPGLLQLLDLVADGALLDPRALRQLLQTRPGQPFVASVVGNRQEEEQLRPARLRVIPDGCHAFDAHASPPSPGVKTDRGPATNPMLWRRNGGMIWSIRT